MIFENFYTNSRGMNVSAGVAEASVEEIIASTPDWLDISSIVYDGHEEATFVFFHNDAYLYILGDREEHRKLYNMYAENYPSSRRLWVHH
jgi:hypothetical protein